MPMIDWRSVVKAVSEATYQSSRFALAIGVTAGALAILPLMTLSVFAIVGILIAVFFSFLLTASLSTGVSDFPMATLFPIFALSISVIVAAILGLFAIAIVVFLYTTLLVLPATFLAEITLCSVRVRSRLGQLVGFVSAGGMLGLVAGMLVFMAMIQGDKLIAGTVGVWGGLVCVFSVTLFGTVLVATDVTRIFLSKILMRLADWVGTLRKSSKAITERSQRQDTTVV